MSPNIARETFESLEEDWQGLLADSYFNSIFSTFAWKKVCWEKLSQGWELFLLAARQEGQLVGIAPIMRRGTTISFIGDERVCDYFDFIVKKGQEERFFQKLIAYLDDQEWQTLDLLGIPQHSPTLNHLPALLKTKGHTVKVHPTDVCPGLDLPGSCEEYLSNLSGKSRHELRRKIRRLREEAEFRFYSVESSNTLTHDLGDFIKMLKESREDKTQFMTPQMEDFFHAMASVLDGEGYLKLFFLEVDGERVSSAMCFDYDGEYLLYNSGYDPRYASLSVGLILKAFCIQDAIASGRRRFDFLKGAEPYKYDLGGNDRPVYRIMVKRH